jgi:hypothetical protein
MAGNEAFLATLPDDVRGEVAFKDIADVGALAKSFLGAQKLIGDRAAGFVNEIPEPIRTDAYFADIKDVPTLAQRAFEQAKLLAAPRDQLLQLPLPTDQPEAWEPVYNRIGRPEKPDGYQLTDPKELPQGFTIDPAQKAEFASWAHQQGMTQKQADAAYQRMTGRLVDGFTAAQQSIADGIAARDQALKTKWGAAHDAKTGDLNLLVEHLAKQFNLGDRLKTAIDQTPGDIGVAVKEAFAEAGALMREHKLIGGGSSAPSGGTALAPAEAQQQINRMYADPATAKALRDQHAPGHAEAVQKLTQLHAFAYPDEQAA